MIRNAKAATLAKAGRMIFFACLAGLAFPLSAAAGERYALVVTGASGGEAYAQKYAKWRASFVGTLRSKFHYDAERLIVLAETSADGAQVANRENVRATLADLRKRMTKDDQLLVLLIGHGTTVDGEEAKFNLVGPDLSASEWGDLLRPIPGRLVFVNTTAPVKSATNAEAGRAESSAAAPICTIRPASSTPTTSPSVAASWKSCVTSSAGTPDSRSTAASARAEVARVRGSRADSGSSSRSTSGFRASARATASGAWRRAGP